ncbi:MAG: D-alanine--D-alanine ligase [Lachnospiraceae bacterium]|nr:D-alanine--D-alanine ligase [Lachnospiraceae bacterium]
MNKTTIAVIFGSRSSEHDVSLISASNVIANINTEVYDIVLIGITKEGKWLLVNSVDDIKNNNWINSTTSAIISPDTTHHGVMLIDETGKTTIKHIDVIFPVLHGLNGEDGTIQGLFELAHIPYVGCGVVSSGMSMDKLFTKIVVDTLGIRQAKYVSIRKYELKDMDSCVAKTEATLDYPMFIKPANAGSSKGISKAHNRDELITGLNEAILHDSKILIEETIIGRELECAVLGSSNPIASGVGEILAAAEFYDFDAKYNNSESKEDTSPALPDGVEDKIREYALKIFTALDGYSLSRVDFFLEKDTNDIVFNEINTIPGFTSISMYPMLWEAKGVSKQQLIEKLIQSGLRRFD